MRFATPERGRHSVAVSAPAPTPWQKAGRLLIAAFAAAAGLASSPALAALAAPDEQDRQLLDQLIGQYVSPEAAPGAAAVLIRRDGRMTLLGYGVTDLATKRAVDPETTVFRLGSISKSFTAIAIMQLVDEGKIALDEDANRYLKGVRIPDAGKPARVIDLLTHRGGFDGNLTHVGLDDRSAAAQSTDQRLQRDLFRVRPSGQLPSYDNLAWGLLGHIVESIDGVPYAQAIRRRIFAPLGMSRSQVGLPDDLSAVAVPYEVGGDGKPHAQPHIFLRRGWQGAGDISSTAGDMSRFLRAMLSEGEYPGGRILKAETFRRMTDTSGFGFHPGLRSIGLGVYALGLNPVGGFGHGGTIRGFNATYMVLPQQDLAMFAVMNLNSPAPEMSLSGIASYIANPPGHGRIDPTDYLTVDLPYELAKRFQTAAPKSSQPPPAEMRDWSGRYAGLRIESYEALLPRLAVALLLNPKTVRVEPGGGLFVGADGPYRRIERGLYTLDKPAGPLTETIGFADVGGQVLMGPHTLRASRRLAWYERPLITAGGLLLAPLLLLVAAVLHRWKAGSGAKADRLLIWSALAFLAGVLLELSLASKLYRVDNLGWVVALWRVGLGAAVLTLCGAVALQVRQLLARQAASAGEHAPPGRLYAGGVSLLVAWTIFAAFYWGLLRLV